VNDDRLGPPVLRQLAAAVVAVVRCCLWLLYAAVAAVARDELLLLLLNIQFLALLLCLDMYDERLIILLLWRL
jgi:hypothetical protein